MGKMYYISKNVGLVLLVLALSALLTIIALSVAYNKERVKNRVGTRNQAVANSTTDTSNSSTPAPVSKDPWDQYRLPDLLVPTSYNVTLWPRLEPNSDGLFIFTGHSAVVFKCLKATDLVLIHSSELNHTLLDGHHARLTRLDGASVPEIRKSWLVVETEYLVLQLRSSLAQGAFYVLYTEFQGELADDLEGFYRSEYVEDGVKKVVATSQMQATYARKAFPCFDEPAMKAVFSVTIIHDRDKVALSNGRQMDVTDAVVDDTAVRVTTFEPTARMSTYLLAFIVSDFSYKEFQQHKGVQVRVWARRKAIEDGQGDYALNVTGHILQFYERYYNTAYPLPKSDQVALPDFNAGAMENWGLVMYRETALLYEPGRSSMGNKDRVMTVIAHELAHQWFGNLVTMQWWNDVWLNEGFASYVEYLGADFAEPTWNIKDHIVLHDIQRVMSVDSLASSHPLSRREDEVNSPAEISEMFSSVSYNKGSAVLRMLSSFLSEPVFVKGLSSYLKAFAFGSTTCSDLWDHLQKAVENTPNVHIPCTVRDIMRRWTLQIGFPLVTIDTRTGNITQKHFLVDPNSVVERPSQFNYTWFVPIQWMKTGVEQQQYWLLHKTDTHTRMRVSGHHWVLANTNVSGYFRVNYDVDNWNRLFSVLETDHQTIPTINRGQIIDDAFKLARAKILDTTLALRTTKYLSREREYIPWQTALSNLYDYFVVFDRTAVYGPLQAYTRKLIQPLFEHFKTTTRNWTIVPETINDQYNQVNALHVACSTGVPACRELTTSWFKQWMDNPHHNPIQPDLRGTVYRMGIEYGGVEEWDFVWTMLKNATLASEESRLRVALACTKVPWLLNRYLEYTLDPAKIRKQDTISTILYISRNIVGAPLAWNFVRARWSDIFQRYGKGSFSISGLVSGIAMRFSTEFELQELQRFKEENLRVGFGSANMALEQTIERISANIKWVTENKARMLAWFSEQST
ncbi:aminopeptidase N-like isoform X1 [Dunckerocampus dactyliophorus]|uniref:aminopeptidase N-like isoform X1 n=2 Tax=Dunckerocampus dactyliophorus TaxID=161453 RepID=UPI0024050AAF|nr:aminopeptidase N-like isoform X1 [Dunckerocampus dactyliophorus]